MADKYHYSNGDERPVDKEGKPIRVLKVQTQWENLFFYQKSDVIYQMAFVFCDRFIHLYKDRTRDQVIQAARSCKQNIVEGLADGVTSTEMQLKLLNVARSSLHELRQDFEDYLKSRHLKFWGLPPVARGASGASGARDSSDSRGSRASSDSRASIIPESYYDRNTVRYDAMLQYCREHNTLADYEPFFDQWTDEELCNYALTLCHMIDKMMFTFMEKLEKEFVTEGGIKERMYKARTGYRNGQDERLKQLETENAQLEAENAQLKAAYQDLKSRALAAYYRQQEEIKALKAKLGED